MIQLQEGQTVIAEDGSVYEIEKGDILQEGQSYYITDKELQDAFPELYRIYKEYYGSSRPKITVDTIEEYRFNPIITDGGTDTFNYIAYVIMRDNDVVVFDAGREDASKKAPNFKFYLKPTDAIMELGYAGYQKGLVHLRVHPSFMNPTALPLSSDLSAPEKAVLVILKSYMSAYRLKNFVHPFSMRGEIIIEKFRYPEKDFWKEVAELTKARTKEEAYATILEMLAQKGYVKISSNGAAQLTMDGKNIAAGI